MKLNKIQVQIFQKMSGEQNMDLEEYLMNFSEEIFNRPISTLEMLTEEEADIWITKSYLKSLG